MRRKEIGELAPAHVRTDDVGTAQVAHRGRGASGAMAPPLRSGTKRCSPPPPHPPDVDLLCCHGSEGRCIFASWPEEVEDPRSHPAAPALQTVRVCEDHPH
jgi:hypothetical protein